MHRDLQRDILFLLDDGWRHEKQVIGRFLAERLPLRMATHNEMTYEALRKDLDIRLLPVHPIRKHPLYTPALFFSRELDTVITRRQRADWLLRASRPVRVLHHVREWMGRKGLRRYRYCDALEWLYRGSNRYPDLLQGCSMLVYSPVSVRDKRVIFEARAAGMKIVSWVYSWDNPLKDNEFLSDADAYLVWNKENLDDVAQLHGVPRERIHIVGPAQMDYLKGRPSSPPAPPPRRYVLYPCSTGRDVYVAQEVEVILDLRKMMDAIDPGVDLLVRPYPFLLNRKDDLYARLRGRKGIEVLQFGQLENGRLLINAQVEEERYLQFRDAVCMVNPGSTIGLEAAYTDAPILQLHYCDTQGPTPELALRSVFRNEHLKYVLLPEYPNVVNSREALERALRDIFSGRTEPYRAYSAALRTFSDPLGVPCYKQVLCDTLERLAREFESSASP